MAKNKKLKPDGAYGRDINGYDSERFEARDPNSGKERFLRDAAAVLREVGKHLVAQGLSEKEIRSNRAGPAVAGEVWAYYWQADNPARRVYCQIGAIGVFGGRTDGVTILARVQLLRKETGRGAKAVWRYDKMGVNQWLSAALDSAEIAARLLTIFNPATSPAATQFCTRAQGVLPVPAPVAALLDDEARWRIDLARCMWADQADASAMVVPESLAALPLFELAAV